MSATHIIRCFSRRGPFLGAQSATFLRPSILPRCSFSDGGGSITYSGGQASQGQGGFYGSGGSRVAGAPSHHSEALAAREDIIEIEKIMTEVAELEEKLDEVIGTAGSSINENAIELKTLIRRKICNKSVMKLLGRLEIKGQPVWGLTANEREIVELAREKYNAA